MKVVVTGNGGQLASEFKALIAFDSNWVFLSENDLDITNLDLVLTYFNSTSCDLSINCAAFTAVDKAEEEEELAYKVNALGIKNLLKACEINRIKLIHYSTDYVFDGISKIPYNELDKPKPNSVYGYTKLKGEECILENKLVKSIIIRTSWVYSIYGNNFVKTMIKLGAERTELGIVADQVGSPTYAKDIAEDTLKIILFDNYKWISGDIFHYSNNGYCSWYDFATRIFDIINYDIHLKELSTNEYPTKAVRPKFSLLDSLKCERTFNTKINDWETSLAEMLKQELAV